MKLLLGIVLLGVACRIAGTDFDKDLKNGRLVSGLTREPTPPNIRSRKTKTETVANLISVERFDLTGNRII